MLPLWTRVTLLRLWRMRVVEGGADQALGALARDRLDADARGRREADLLHAHLVLQERDDLLGLGRFGGPLDAGVDVLGVLAEDHHVDLLGRLHRRRHALEVAHRAQADVEVQHLADGDVQRADAAADRGRQRALDADEVGLERLQRLVGQPGVEQLLRLLAGVDLGPGDLLLARRTPSRPRRRARARRRARCRARCRRLR